MRRAYALRSKLAHVSLSPGAPEALEGVRLGSELGEDAVLCALPAFGETGLRSERVNRRHLSDWFNQIALGAEAHSAQRQSEESRNRFRNNGSLVSTCSPFLSLVSRE